MTLDENDFLTFQLYVASKTPRIKKARFRSWILTTFTFLCLAYLFFQSENAPLGNYFLVLSGLSFVLFPFYSRWRYKRHYIQVIRDTYKNKLGEKCELQVDNETIVIKDKTGELRINKTEIEEINEINDYYFLKTRSGVTVLLSKKKSDDIDIVDDLINSLVGTFGVRHTIELDRKWR